MKRTGKLDSNRVTLLDDIGFVWDLQDQQWTLQFRKLQAYQLQHGPGSSPPSNYTKDTQLGRWVHTQRVRKRKDKLDSNRVTLLDEIGFEWEPRAKD